MFSALTPRERIAIFTISRQKHGMTQKTFPTLTSAMALVSLAGSVFAAPEKPSHVIRSFERVSLSDQFWCEGANAGDFNNDGKQDIVAGPWWWEGPDFKTRHELYKPEASFQLKLGESTKVAIPGFEGGLGKANAYSDNFFAWPYDFNADGWQDVLVVGFPGKMTAWFENPKNGSDAWTRHPIFMQTDNESPTFADLTGDGKPELICITKGAYGYAAPDWSAPAKQWTWHRLSPNKNYGNFTHGMGVGDVNDDGRMDVLEKSGWYEQPASLEGDPEWVHHDQNFASAGGAQMLVYDVNGDGTNDVITSLAAHGFGLAWYEQTKTSGGIQWKQHLIMGQRAEENRYGVKFSELHALDLVDMNGDGLKDIVTGKRFWSHGRTGDPDRNDQAVIYWFELSRSDSGVDWIPHLIDNNSGVGTQVVAKDVNNDGQSDVIIGNKKGVFVHLQKVKAATAEEVAAAQPKPHAPAKIGTPSDAKTPEGRKLNFDFETGDGSDWTSEGKAFAQAVVKGDAVNARRKDMRSGHAGEFWIGGYEKGGDEATGTLTSKPFVLAQPYLGFLIGGGSGKATRVEIVNALSHAVIATATGPDNEEMVRAFTNLDRFMGTAVYVRLVDEATSGWGHINFDDLKLYDAPPANAREF